ncbi:MAG TPA: hypothetical protein VD763_11930 [Candidatus Saccharimonadales bacterium]|nr:hypothetical protein [Candidatus Saccharimonadales bacterium]
MTRERVSAARPDDHRPRWGYAHPGHEPAGYRLTGRGTLADLENERRAQTGEPFVPVGRTGGRERDPQTGRFRRRSLQSNG